MKTDCQKVLEALQKVGSVGIHSFDLNHLVGTTRSAARIADLKKQGYKISSVYERKGNAVGVRYFISEKKQPALQWVFEQGIARQVEKDQTAIQQGLGL